MWKVFLISTLLALVTDISSKPQYLDYDYGVKFGFPPHFHTRRSCYGRFCGHSNGLDNAHSSGNGYHNHHSHGTFEMHNLKPYNYPGPSPGANKLMLPVIPPYRPGDAHRPGYGPVFPYPYPHNPTFPDTVPDFPYPHHPDYHPNFPGHIGPFAPNHPPNHIQGPCSIGEGCTKPNDVQTQLPGSTNLAPNPCPFGRLHCNHHYHHHHPHHDHNNNAPKQDDNEDSAATSGEQTPLLNENEADDEDEAEEEEEEEASPNTDATPMPTPIPTPTPTPAPTPAPIMQATVKSNRSPEMDFDIRFGEIGVSTTEKISATSESSTVKTEDSSQ